MKLGHSLLYAAGLAAIAYGLWRWFAPKKAAR